MLRIPGKCDSEGRPIIEVAVSPTRDGVGGDALAFPALIDTGADSTSISANIARGCRIVPRGAVSLRGITGTSRKTSILRFYLLFMASPENPGGHDMQPIPIDGYRNFLPASARFEIIIGRDVLRRGDFFISRCDDFEFSF